VGALPSVGRSVCGRQGDWTACEMVGCTVCEGLERGAPSRAPLSSGALLRSKTHGEQVIALVVGVGIKESQPDKSGGRVCGTTRRKKQEDLVGLRERDWQTHAATIFGPPIVLNTIGAPSKLK
jgi:hypothetical protein